ncbi:MAG: family 10 glycosylhydrolase [Gemmatimonadetes bacterium]|nr:family 10 glycosylhydrolase [Gemmatimonadota bacterium]
MKPIAILLGGAALAAACARGPSERPLPRFAEVRALWVVRNTLTHPDSVKAMVRRVHAAGFNTLIVQVRGRGDAFYDSRWEPRADTLVGARQKFDPLALVLREAHARGLAVHAWVNTHLLANMDAPPRDPAHLYHTRPDLLMVPKPLARELHGMDPREPRYREALVEYARANRNRVEGLYSTPSAPEVKEHVYSIWMDVLERYDVDGIHFDYVRFPAPEFDYSRGALERFRGWLVPQLAPEAQARIAPLEPADPLVWADSFPEAWDRFRRLQVTELVERIYHGVKKRKPQALVTAAVFANAEDAYRNRFQDWRDWLRRGFLDVAALMAYTPETPIFREQIRMAVETAGGSRVWAGIGSWRIPVESAVEKIGVARELGTAGVVLFSYDGAVRKSETNPDAAYLQRIRELAFRPVAADGRP